jgi:N-acetylmuramoyl-L-alanine amidase
MTIKSFGISGAFRGTTALGLVLAAASGLVSADTAVAQTFAAQLQAPAAATAPSTATATPTISPAAAAPAAPSKAVKVIAATPPTLGTAKSATAPEPAVRPDKSRTRFVIGLENPTEFQVSTLANPNRVIVDLPDVRMQLPPEAGANQGGLVKSFYGGLAAPGKTKVVITVDGPVVVESQKIETSKDGKTHRLVLELAAFDAKSQPKKTAAAGPAIAAPTFALGAAGMAPPMPKQAVRPSVAATKAYKPIIVIDPGHGGHDSGASKFGTIEKNVVLAFSLALRDKLNATGRYIVKMTRDNDTFVDLDKRRDFAEQNKANLFIAVHADYAGAKARGATIYSLRDTVAKDLQRSAKGHASDNLIAAKDEAQIKQANAEQLGTVKGILGDLAQREVSVNNQSTGMFAKSVIETMGETTSMQSNPDRTAAFRVLKSASVPAVLIELAYVSNQQDAANLKSDAWRDKVSASITTAVENYFSNQNAYLLKVGG